MHAVTQANGLSYQYDAYGNIVQRGSETIEYNVFNKPTKIGGTTFQYGPDHQRFKQVDGNRTVYYFNGGQYKEIETDAGTITRNAVGGYYVRETSGSGVKETYLHKDHLGSTGAMMDKWGNLVDRMSFGPWGKRQMADWSDGDPTGGQSGQYPTDKGFTGHEMLDATSLVHMNGRVYDPVIGRFLSPDLLVQAPYNSQSFNRYSYVFNNPLSLVDPSGYKTSCTATSASGAPVLCVTVEVAGISEFLMNAEVVKEGSGGGGFNHMNGPSSVGFGSGGAGGQMPGPRGQVRPVMPNNQERNTFSGSVSVGGSGYIQLGVVGGGISGTVGLDTDGKVCFQSQFCSTNNLDEQGVLQSGGAGLFGGLGLTGSISGSDFQEGTEHREGSFFEAGIVKGGNATILTDKAEQIKSIEQLKQKIRKGSVSGTAGPAFGIKKRGRSR